MGSKKGYAYYYEFSLGDLSEMKSAWTCGKQTSPGRRDVLVEVTTLFSISTRKGGDPEIKSEESFDIRGLLEGCDLRFASMMSYDRLLDYWMTYDEIDKFAEQLMAFVKEIGDENPSLPKVPVYVDFEVRTVQQEGEAYDATEARAIVASKLDPVYLFSYEYRWSESPEPRFLEFIVGLPRTRVENVDEGWDMMNTCILCVMGPCIGDQIVKLKCGCTFHSHCILRSLEHNCLCPRCSLQQF